MAKMTVFVFNVAGYLIEGKRRWLAINRMLPHEDNILNKFRIRKERHIRMRKQYQMPGWTKHILYSPTVFELTTAHTPSLQHGQGVPRP